MITYNLLYTHKTSAFSMRFPASVHSLKRLITVFYDVLNVNELRILMTTNTSQDTQEITTLSLCNVWLYKNSWQYTLSVYNSISSSSSSSKPHRISLTCPRVLESLVISVWLLTCWLTLLLSLEGVGTQHRTGKNITWTVTYSLLCDQHYNDGIYSADTFLQLVIYNRHVLSNTAGMYIGYWSLTVTHTTHTLMQCTHLCVYMDGNKLVSILYNMYAWITYSQHTQTTSKYAKPLASMWNIAI